MYTQSISISMTMLIDTGENTNSYSLRHHESGRPVLPAQAIIDAQISILCSISLLVSMLGVGPEMLKYLENQINSCNWLYLIKSNDIAIFDTYKFLPKFSLLHCLPVNIWARRWRIPCPEWEKAKKQVLQTMDGQTNTTITKASRLKTLLETFSLTLCYIDRQFCAGERLDMFHQHNLILVKH